MENLNEVIDLIQRDLIDSSVSLSSILLKAKVLAHGLKNDQLKQWVRHELDGYQNEGDIPDYRVISVIARADFSNGAWMQRNALLPLDDLPEWLQEQGRQVKLRDGVRSLEELARRDSETTYGWPAHWVGYWNHVHVNDVADYACLTVRLPVPAHAFAQILDTVRSRLQDFILEISDLPWNMGRGELPPKEEVQRLVNVTIFNHAEGGKVSTFDQRGQNVTYQYNAAGNINFGAVQNTFELVGELEKLRAELWKAGEANVIDGEIVDDAEHQLAKAIRQANKPQPDKKSIVEHLTGAKALLDGVTAAAGMVQGLTQAAEAAQRLFS